MHTNKIAAKISHYKHGGLIIVKINCSFFAFRTAGALCILQLHTPAPVAPLRNGLFNKLSKILKKKQFERDAPDMQPSASLYFFSENTFFEIKYCPANKKQFTYNGQLIRLAFLTSPPPIVPKGMQK